MPWVIRKTRKDLERFDMTEDVWTCRLRNFTSRLPSSPHVLSRLSCPFHLPHLAYLANCTACGQLLCLPSVFLNIKEISFQAAEWNASIAAPTVAVAPSYSPFLLPKFFLYSPLVLLARITLFEQASPLVYLVARSSQNEPIGENWPVWIP